MACRHSPSNNRYGVNVVIVIPSIFCILKSAIERAGKVANATAESANASETAMGYFGDVAHDHSPSVK
jgi:hypothetical protein